MGTVAIVSDRNADREGAAMNQLETGEMPKAAQAVPNFQDELAEVIRQRAAISAVLRVIASSPHDLQSIFDTIADSARTLSRGSGLSSRCACIEFRRVGGRFTTKAGGARHLSCQLL
jgi:hypothetical protein